MSQFLFWAKLCAGSGEFMVFLTEAFDAKCRLDIGQDVEVPIMIITTGGFSQSAINYARERNIVLATLNYEATPDNHTLEFMGHPLIVQLSRNVRTAIKQEHPV